MKKIISFVLLISLVFALIGCSVKDTSEFEDKTKETTEETPEKQIGRIITHEDFLTEFTKRVDLNDYNLKFTDHDYILEYDYSSKTDCEITQSEKNFQVDIDGVKVTLPLTVKEFMDLGFELISMNKVDAPVNLSGVGSNALFDVKTPKGNTFSIFAISKDSTPVNLQNLIVMQISCGFYGDTIKYGEGERDDAPEIVFFNNVNDKSTVDGIVKELKTPQAIKFSQTLYNGKTTLALLKLTFAFSNQKYTGDIHITAHTILDESINRTSYVTTLSYRIDYECIITN